MYLKTGFVLVLPISLLGFTSFARAQDTPASKTLTIEADEWCPINCNPEGPQLGIGIDLARKIFEPLGYKINYVVVPWTQALADARSGKADAVVGANHADDPTLIFPDHAITTITDDFFVLQGVAWRYQGEYTLKGKHIGVVEGYGYGDVVTKFITDNKNSPGIINAAEGKEALKHNLDELVSRHLDVVIESKAVMDYNLQKWQMADKIVWAGGVPQAPVFVAFSPKLAASRELQLEYDQGIKRLQATGALDAMYAPYRLKPQ